MKNPQERKYDVEVVIPLSDKGDSELQSMMTNIKHKPKQDSIIFTSTMSQYFWTSDDVEVLIKEEITSLDLTKYKDVKNLKITVIGHRNNVRIYNVPIKQIPVLMKNLIYLLLIKLPKITNVKIKYYTCCFWDKISSEEQVFTKEFKDFVGLNITNQASPYIVEPNPIYEYLQYKINPGNKKVLSKFKNLKNQIKDLKIKGFEQYEFSELEDFIKLINNTALSFLSENTLKNSDLRLDVESIKDNKQKVKDFIKLKNKLNNLKNDVLSEEHFRILKPFNKKVFTKPQNLKFVQTIEKIFKNADNIEENIRQFKEYIIIKTQDESIKDAVLKNTWHTQTFKTLPKLQHSYIDKFFNFFITKKRQRRKEGESEGDNFSLYEIEDGILEVTKIDRNIPVKPKRVDQMPNLFSQYFTEDGDFVIEDLTNNNLNNHPIERREGLNLNNALNNVINHI